EELTMKLGLARGCDFPDLAGQVFSDARDLSERGLVERSQMVRVIAGDVRDVAIRADLERILALDFEKVGDFREAGPDGRVIQTGDLPSRCESRGRAPRLVARRRQWTTCGRAARNRTGTLRHRRRTPLRPSRPRL